MNCDLANRYLDAFVDGELEPRVESELEEHLRNCLSCQSQTWEIREFRSQFRMHAPRFDAPAQLRAKVLGMIYRAQARRLRSLLRYVWIGAPVVLVAGIALGLLISAPDHGKQLSQQAVADYDDSELSASPRVELASADFAVLKPWFSNKVGFTPPAIDLHEYGYELTGGRVGVLGRRQVVALVYRRGDEILTIYCWPPTEEPVSYGQRSIEGYRVYTWSNSACNYVLVQRSNDPKIEQFVDSFQDQPVGTFY
jgi:anti-sigma factor RsiW